MGAVLVYGTSEIEERIANLQKSGIGDFKIEYADWEQTIIERAIDDRLSIEFENTALQDELKDAQWAGRDLQLADTAWRQ